MSFSNLPSRIFTRDLCWALCLTIPSLLTCHNDHALATDWSIPFAGNSFRTTPEGGGNSLRRNGNLSWNDLQEVYSIFFHIDRSATLELSLDGDLPEGESEFIVRGPMQQEFKLGLASKEKSLIPIGSIKCDGPQYVRLDLQGLKRTGQNFVQLRNLVVKSDTVELAVDYVRTNEGNMFYWGRRGPSVHLSYQVPKEVDLQYAYSELTVPVGQDPIGSYFMANGFAQGYFGMQVNGPNERRILFSVWSPFQTDNPRDIPVDQRVVLLSKGENTRSGEFGSEGSGGQSYRIYPWKSGETYRFLTEVRPVQDDKTIYTCWFAPKSEDWQLVASFQRPKTNSHLRGFHSFLESFDPSRGHVQRRCSYGNIWVCDTTGRWHACDRAKFSVDPTGGGRHRLDFEGGVEADQFYLRNCGFFSGKAKTGEIFKSQIRPEQPPKVDFATLPR
jgi:Domain of unknown function (DUF3472)/Domain of unknown function (DUF5077)